MERPELPSAPAPATPVNDGPLPADAEETMHQRHQDTEEIRHQPRETGSGKEGGPPKT
jgi:hypothetical protein